MLPGQTIKKQTGQNVQSAKIRRCRIPAPSYLVRLFT
uniref:Uncharacterized protein n=1 Tax=Siphoviridae sp. ctMRT7 TaxID=2827855 RepID=A0A8S5SS70_9CAUD|nr:MAG TPA: hypothetical protein [Siphoviridae sp. ctMRT7]